MEEKRIHKFSGYWISTGKTMMVPTPDSGNAPVFRKTFTLGAPVETAKVYLCGLGWHELYLNGKKVDDRVLVPAVTRFEVRANYLVYDVGDLLQPGENCIAVILGNGWYNCQSTQKFSFDKAPWRDYPKLICDVIVNQKTVAVSDSSWKFTDSPITYDALRCGERYDARAEVPGFADAGTDDSNWNSAARCFPPGGDIEEEQIEPCRIMKRIKPVGVTKLFPDVHIYDFGANLTGWCEITVRGKAGASVTIEYSEKIRANGDVDNAENARFIKETPFQQDIYTLKGDGIEVWHPRFTYHGFRYAKLWARNLEVISIEAHFVHTDLTPVGTFETESSYLNKLHEITIRSYLANFTGIPTDCPHREKNGWTGDAHLGCLVGMWNFDSKKAYLHYLRILTDCQRKNGQLPCIAPTGGTYGFNWGAGPVFDFMLFEGVWQIWRFYGDTAPIEEFYDNMARYLEFCLEMSTGDLVEFGLTDWAHPHDVYAIPLEVVSSSFYYNCLQYMITFAEVTGRAEDAAEYCARAERVKTAFRKKFCRPDGSCNQNSMTELACALYYKFTDTPELTAALLAQKCREAGHRAIFGIAGAKLVPRVLADYGYAEDAYKIATQEEFPGWGYSIKQGATTLWEQWNGINSHCHIMYGSIDAWMYEYLAGIRIEEPAFKVIRFAPCFIKDLNGAEASRTIPQGTVSAKWKRIGENIEFECHIPEGSAGILEINGICETGLTGVQKRIFKG
ncbi:MAG: family 78 glycoside hydrolase catalytic domain [Lentisphaeria bacterium]|nr:family 78 glycoside hydrolase catalytic domain [Lentisphaeria bacterium]